MCMVFFLMKNKSAFVNFLPLIMVKFDLCIVETKSEVAHESAIIIYYISQFVYCYYDMQLMKHND